MEGYLAQIILFGGNFAPRGWAFCQGQLLSIAQNTPLFALIGTTYGGNGQTTFGLPDLRGRVAVGTGQGPGLPAVVQGELAGSPTTTLLVTNLPAHTHQFQVPATSSEGNTRDPSNAILAKEAAGVTATYSSGTADATSRAGNTGVTGGTQPFSIQSPYLGLNYIICIEGAFPSRN